MNFKISKSDFCYRQFKNSGEQFFKDLLFELNQLGLSIENSQCDHLCFRVSSETEYQFYKAEILNHGQLLTEALVNGRAICTFRLNEPFKNREHEIKLLELPAPKTGSFYSTGFEHAEFVIEESFESLQKKHPQLQFKSGGNPILNPELSLSLSPNKQVKFHYQPLYRVIQLEEAKIQDIIFDFDGTIIKSRETIYEINRVVFSEATGREVLLQEAIEKFHPEFTKLFEAFQVYDPEKRSRAVERWGQVSEKFSYELFDGALDCLKILKQNDFRLHLWTARDEYSTKLILKDHQLESFFETMNFASQYSSKPDPDGLNINLKGLAPDQAIVIGDSSTDMLGAKNISAIAGAALWDAHADLNKLIGAGAEVFFKDFSSLTEWLIKMR